MNFISVCVGFYHANYVYALHNSVRKHCSHIKKHFCISDDFRKLPKFVRGIKPNFPCTGWWNKMHLFSDSMPVGINLYMDLDIVVLKSFDREIEYSLNLLTDNIICCSDAIHWKGQKFSSSLMLFKSHSQLKLYHTFVQNFSLASKCDGGDQIFIGKNTSNFYFLDDVFSDFKLNYKFHLLNSKRNFTPNTKMVDFGGFPKPHQLADDNIFKSIWLSNL